ncbi:MAG TPA: hypothetical protein VHT03_02780 [Rhizomicrobium sp.]|jgi:hypothetical protein|nr:hypothetical protein [Rhizomicrobium sp.]
MSVADKTPIVRRSFISGLMGVVALMGIAALEAPRLFPGLFAKRYPPTAFDDLFALLTDRENAIRIGTVLVQTGRGLDVRSMAAELRRKLGGHSLAVAIADDLAHSRLIEAQGWLLPECVGELCAIAAMAERP